SSRLIRYSNPEFMLASILLDNTGSVQQAIALLDTLSSEQFVRVEKPAYEASIGAHLRHNIDHYHCFCQGLADGRVDYDHRVRDHRLERELPLAKAILEGVVTDLSEIQPADLDRDLQVKMDCGGESEWSASSVRRELQFLLSHTVHHYALVGMICRMQGHAIPQDFGVAPSTLKFRQAQASQACAR
ncbi:DinB family protein, partial [bacterium]|nr:DinB family protein [bacterium]